MIKEINMTKLSFLMNRTRQNKNLILAAFFTLLLPATFTHAEETGQQGYDGITAPIGHLQLSFVQPGKLAAIEVQEGEQVTAGQLLAKQDDGIEQAQLRILEARINNLTPIQLAEVALKQKLYELEQLKNANKKGATTRWEVDQASIAADTARLSLKMREFDREQDQLQLASVQESINKLSITSPINGVIEEIHAAVGEGVQALEPVITLVKTDFLIIDLPVPLEKAKTLQTGQICRTAFTDGTVKNATIEQISTVADGAASTLEIKLLLPNNKKDEKRPAGERVIVNCPGGHESRPDLENNATAVQ